MPNSRFIFLPQLLLITLLSLSFSAVSAKTVDNFSFQDTEGKSHDFSDYKGKWVVVNYWAIFCPPCRVEIPDLIRFLDANADKVAILGMDAGMDEVERLEEFAKEQRINYPIIPTQNSTMMAFGEVPGLPTTYIVSPAGELVDTHIGVLSYAQLDEYINAKQATVKEESFWEKLFSWGKS